MAADEERRAARASWPIHVYRLGEEPREGPDPDLSAEERVALVWQLTQQAWAMAGREIPDYEREKMPVRCFRAEGHRTKT